MSEQQVLPELEPTEEEIESAASFWPSAEDNSLVRYYFSTTKCRERQLRTALASLAQSEAERERLQGERKELQRILGHNPASARAFLATAQNVMAGLAREREANQWIDVNQVMPTERERVLCKFEDHPAEVCWWFKWPELEKALWHPGIWDWGRVTHWKQIEPPALLEDKSKNP